MTIHSISLVFTKDMVLWEYGKRVGVFDSACSSGKDPIESSSNSTLPTEVTKESSLAACYATGGSTRPAIIVSTICFFSF